METQVTVAGEPSEPIDYETLWGVPDDAEQTSTAFACISDARGFTED